MQGVYAQELGFITVFEAYGLRQVPWPLCTLLHTYRESHDVGGRHGLLAHVFLQEETGLKNTLISYYSCSYVTKLFLLVQVSQMERQTFSFPWTQAAGHVSLSPGSASFCRTGKLRRQSCEDLPLQGRGPIRDLISITGLSPNVVQILACCDLLPQLAQT